MRLWVNGQGIIDCRATGCGHDSNTISLTIGVKVPIKMEFFEWDHCADAHLTMGEGSSTLCPAYPK